MKTSESIDLLITALAKAKLEIKGIAMSGRNPFFKNAANPDGSKYSTFTDLYNGTNEPLSKNGLVLAQFPYNAEAGRVGVLTYLAHSSGQWISNDGIPLKPDKDTPQSYASALTYSKRQEGFAILGLSGDPDDDGNEANGYLDGSSIKKDSHKNPSKPKESKPETQIEVKLFDQRVEKHLVWLEDKLVKKNISKDSFDAIAKAFDQKPWTPEEFERAVESVISKS